MGCLYSRKYNMAEIFILYWIILEIPTVLLFKIEVLNIIYLKFILGNSGVRANMHCYV